MESRITRRRFLLMILLNMGLLAALAPLAQPAAATGNYKLPTRPNEGITVTQDNNTDPTHRPNSINAWSWDFGLIDGSPVYTSRAGYVRMVREDSNIAGCGEQYADFANYIVIDHQDGTASLYLHLQQNGALVDVNQRVEQGQHIGYSGATGNTCGPHLHFAVQDYVPGQPFTQSRPVIFADHNDPDDNGVPDRWDTVVSRNHGLNAATIWYFAEGYTGVGFDEFLTIQNPNPTATSVTITYYLTGAGTQTKSLTVGANSRFTVAVHETQYGVGRGQAVSARLQANQPIIVERPMYFNYGSGQKGGHNGVGVTPRIDVGQFVWWFAEGWTGSGFDEFLTIQNPNDLAASVTFTYMLEGGGEIVVQDFVPGNQRKTFNVRNQIGSDKAVSLKLRADRPVNAERPMYFNYYSSNTGLAEGGHNTPGAVTPEYTWYFAEGTTRVGFDQYLTIQNPGNAGPHNAFNSWASVEVTYYTTGGSRYGPYTYSIPPKTRATIIPRDLLGWNQDFTTQIKSNFPVVVERPMYFRYGAGDWRDGTVVVGTPKPEYRFYFAEGWTGDGFDEFLAIHNTNDTAYTLVTVQYMLPGGGGTTKNYWVAPKARLTLNVRAEIGNNQAVSMKVSSDLPIVAERPMYFNYNGSMGLADGGHVAIGYSP